MKITLLPALVALTAVSACAPAFAAPAAGNQQATAHKDTEFLKEANQGSVDEIDLAQLALKKSSNPDVKDFAQKMVQDHQTLIDDMKPFDMEAGIEPPSHPSAATEATKLKLDLLSGAKFDKAYIKDMVEDHHKDLMAFRKAAAATQYPAFKTAVEKGEKVVHEHLEMINGIAKKNGVAPAPAGE